MSFDFESKVWTGIASPYLFGGQGLGEVIWEFMDENPDHIMQVWLNSTRYGDRYVKSTNIFFFLDK